MAKHKRRLTTPPPTHVRVAAASGINGGGHPKFGTNAVS